MNGLAPAFGALAAIVAIADTIPYLRDTVRRSTSPYRATWLVWAVLAIVVCGSQRADGATWSLAMAAMQALLTTLVFALSIRLGSGGLNTVDALLLVVAGAGVLGWLVADEPVVGTACVIAADLVAAAMMMPKTWRDPGSETLATFALGTLGGALAALSVGALSVSLLLYPVYFCLANGAIALLIAYRRAALAHPRPPLRRPT